MLTVLGYALLAIVLVAGLFFLGATVLPAGEQLAPPVRDEPHWAVQHGRPVTAEDVENVRLPVALRGYRFAETDELLDTLADQLRWRDAEIARLRAVAGLNEAPTPSAPPAGPAPVVPDDEGWTRPVDEAETEPDPIADAGDEAVEEAAVRDHAAPRPVE